MKNVYMVLTKEFNKRSCKVFSEELYVEPKEELILPWVHFSHLWLNNLQQAQQRTRENRMLNVLLKGNNTKKRKFPN